MIPDVSLPTVEVPKPTVLVETSSAPVEPSSLLETASKALSHVLSSTVEGLGWKLPAAIGLPVAYNLYKHFKN